MKKYSQEELLNEGVWGAVKAIGRGADYLIGKAAPEVQKLYKDPINAAVGLKDAVMGNTVKNPNYGKEMETDFHLNQLNIIHIQKNLKKMYMVLL
jgi:hypothetical protein